ncbi:carbohydrate sulfotransferase 4-like [Tubulanus polymorphus]|uniref:carbohydrate sulfotransferase 4-like n=1 Tax=Tubulanus polymorphus TaxID=672921 RepID=UPI003DA410D9
MALEVALVLFALNRKILIVDPDQLGTFVSAKTRTTQPSAEPMKVLLFTHYRGGSSFFGETFNQNPSVFYLYEPAMFVNELGIDKYGLSGKEKFTKVLNELASCDLHRLQTTILNSHKSFYSRTRLGGSEFVKCATSAKGKVTNFMPAVAKCLTDFENQCKQSRIRVIKIIRFDAELIELLMRSDPSWHVIHLLRDPRGILNSRSQIHHYTSKDIPRFANSTCRVLLNRIESLEQLKIQHPLYSLHEVRYEDIARDPIGQTSRVYEAIGLDEVPVQVKTWLSKMTHTDPNARITNIYKPSPKDSVANSYKWNKSISVSNLIEINHVCGELFAKTGYPLYKPPE